MQLRNWVLTAYLRRIEYLPNSGCLRIVFFFTHSIWTGNCNKILSEFSNFPQTKIQTLWPFLQPIIWLESKFWSYASNFLMLFCYCRFFYTILWVGQVRFCKLVFNTVSYKNIKQGKCVLIVMHDRQQTI